MRYLLTLLLVAVLVTPAIATPPAIGTYGPETGRFSESWKNGQEGKAENTINALSWNGSVLGAQWQLSCMVAIADAVETDRQLDGNGTGYVKFKTVYEGGPMWLSGSGPWGDGSEDYNCVIGSGGMVVTVTHQFVLGVWQSAVSDITVGGVFENYSNCFTYTLTNAAILGMGTAPDTDYPDFQDETCATGTSVYGAWGSVTDITLTIYSPTDPVCTIPTRQATWGEIKTLYTK